MAAFACNPVADPTIRPQEKDPVTRLLSLVSNLSGAVFFPIEHVAWAADQKILTVNAGPWWTAAIACWAISLAANILRGIRTIIFIRYKRAKLLKRKKLESPDMGDESATAIQTAMADLKCLEKTEYLLLLKNLTDFLNAINWMPPGFLWAGRFNTLQTGLFGTIASIIGLIMMVNATR